MEPTSQSVDLGSGEPQRTWAKRVAPILLPKLKAWMREAQATDSAKQEKPQDSAKPSAPALKREEQREIEKQLRAGIAHQAGVDPNEAPHPGNEDS